MIRRRVVAIAVVLLALGVACGAPKSGEFTAIDGDRIPAPLTATTTTTTIPSTTTTIAMASTTTLAEIPPTTIVNELASLYFIVGREQVVSIDVALARPVSVGQVMKALESGPTGDGTLGLRTAIPPGTESTTTEDRGVITVDLPIDFFTLNDENPNDQRLAVAQIVLTLTQLRGISQVRFTQNGELIQVLLSDGSLSEVGQTLYEADYESLLNSSQTATTTTTTTTTSTTTVASSSPDPSPDSTAPQPAPTAATG